MTTDLRGHPMIQHWCFDANVVLCQAALFVSPGCGSRLRVSAIHRAHCHDPHWLTICGCGLCKAPVWCEHHPQRGVHGECSARLLQGHQDWQDPSSQVVHVQDGLCIHMVLSASTSVANHDSSVSVFGQMRHANGCFIIDVSALLSSTNVSALLPSLM